MGDFALPLLILLFCVVIATIVHLVSSRKNRFKAQTFLSTSHKSTSSNYSVDDSVISNQNNSINIETCSSLSKHNERDPKVHFEIDGEEFILIKPLHRD